jgi:polar amino acid transport system substrate-binding protein
MPRILRLPPFLVFLLLLAIAGSVQAAADTALERIQQRGALILGTSGNMPSMSEVDASGKASGFDIDLARIMADLMGVKLEIRVMPFSELLTALEAGQVDVVISNVTITPKRNLKVAFVGPYMTSGKCIVTKSEALANAGQSQDLNTPETRLAVLGGSTSEDFAHELFPNATLLQVADYVQAADLVKSDKASGMLTDYPICVATLKSNPDAGFVSVFSLLTYEPIGIALPPNDAQFINWTENFLDRLTGTNGIKELSARWFGKTRLKRQ